MSSIIGRSAFRATRVLRAEASSATAANIERQAGKEAVKQGAKRDPELYVRQSRALRSQLDLETTVNTKY